MTPPRGRRGSDSGQVLVGVIVLLAILTILVPAMVLYTQREALWTAKQTQNTTAFHLAESGVEKAFLTLSLSTGAWRQLQQSGTGYDDFKWDKSFSDVPGGTYTVSITSGPDTEQATVISVGRESKKKEVRALKVIYSNATLGGIAVYSAAGVRVGGGVTVEWGAIVSPLAIDFPALPTFPSAYSADAISPWPYGQSNCDTPDCCQFFQYYSNIPPEPVLDLSYYKSSATATTGCPAGGNPAGSCYYDTAQSWSDVTETRGVPYYVDGNLTVGSPGIDIIGSLIVIGNLQSTSGNWGKGSRTMKVPRDAWKQYCHDWAHYQPMDNAEPATYPGKNSSYKSASTLTYSDTPNNKTAISGLLYVQGNFSVGGGGGNTSVHGVMFVLGTTTMTSNSGVTVWYDKDAASAIQTTKIILTRDNWQDAPKYKWPTGLDP
ncbi:MAG: pilus assembly PilX N-terminal domain-containing protein [Elusimicrobia bacterium]|nr:pilus assembly PilX N-terminal domain-containing protein [Elusimicrobiota bacterium]